MIIPNIYWRYGSANSEYHTANKEFEYFAEALMDKMLHKDWRSYLKTRIGDNFFFIEQIGYVQGRAFSRRFKKGTEFNLEGKAADINDFINEGLLKKNEVNKYKSEQQRIVEIIAPVIEKYKSNEASFTLNNDFSITINLHVYLGDNEKYSEWKHESFAKCSINREGKISPPVQKERIIRNVEEAKEFVNKYTPHNKDVLYIANKLLTDLPKEYFIEPEKPEGEASLDDKTTKIND